MGDKKTDRRLRVSIGNKMEHSNRKKYSDTDSSSSGQGTQQDLLNTMAHFDSTGNINGYFSLCYRESVLYKLLKTKFIYITLKTTAIVNFKYCRQRTIPCSK